MINISIIVPVYNSEKYLEKCLSSIANQTLQNIEIILINDGSTDNSAKICDLFAQNDQRIKVLHKKNEGQGIARNIGLELAQGDFVSFIDADDFLDRDFYEKLYHYAIIYNADIACGNIVKLFANNKEENYGLGKYLKNKITLIEEISEKQYLIYTDLFVDKIIKKDLLKKYKIKFDENNIFEDTSIGLNLALAAKKTIFVPEVKYYYVQHQSSTMHNFSNNTIEIFNILYKMHEKINLTYSDIAKFDTYQQILYMRDFRQLFFFIFSTDKNSKNKILKLSKNYLKEFTRFYNRKYSNLDIDARIFIIKHSPNITFFMFSAYLYYFWEKIIKQYLKKWNIL